MNYQDVFERIPSMYSEFKSNADAAIIYETIISDSNNLINMIQFSNCRLPALNAVADKITKYCADPECTVKLTKKSRAFFGTLISLELEAFGYVQFSRGKITYAESQLNSFTTGAKYHFDPNVPRTKKIDIIIRSI